MLGGYAWSANVYPSTKMIHLDVYILMSASRVIPLGNGQMAEVEMHSEMPWRGYTTVKVSAPADWQWSVKLPMAEYATNAAVRDAHVARRRG